MPRTTAWGGRDDPARRLWSLWRQGQRPRVEEFLARAGIGEPGQILAVLRVDQSERFRLGEWVRAEAYLEAYPAVRDDPERAVDLIFAEYLLREEAGQRPTPEEYSARFPRHAEELKLQLALHRAVETGAETATHWPGWGATVGGDRDVEPGRGPDGFPAIPGYEVRGILGRGGMGVVYRAWQIALNRSVALKMVTAGALADRQTLARFRVEAEAVARLQHPDIVAIHDVGQHAGAPFLVLELVEGRSLSHRVAGTPQPDRWSAALLEELARAMHAAHQQGVVHRDLTPANILLAVDGRPKITDFGLAKLVIGGSDLRTQTGELLGTPSYMAPEQAAGRRRSIGPATDVYALGAILYELLTGRPPFKAESPLETLHQVMRDEPVPPSRLRPKLPRDLETICLKCLRKEPARRYAGALELAEDLRRYLEGRPILARPIGPAGRLWRRCRRNPLVAALWTLVFGLIVTLFVGSAVAALRLKGSRDEALFERNRAEDNFREARLAVDDSFTKISESALLDAPGMQPLRKQLLEGALKYYQGFVARLGGQPEVRADLAAALDRVARITSEIGSKEEALGYLHKVRGIYQALASARPDDARLRRELARSIAAIAQLRGEAGRREEAASEYRQALAIQRALVAADPADARAQDDLAASETGLGQVLVPLDRRDEALRCHERALAIRQRLVDAFPDVTRFRSDLALDHTRIGILHRDADRVDEAIRCYGRALEIQQAMVADHPGVAAYRSGLAKTYTLLGVVQRHANRLDEALDTYQKARASQEAMAAANPSVNDYRYDLARTLNNIANIQSASGHKEEAVVTHRKALEIREALVAANPRVVRYQNDLAGSFNAIGMNQAELGHWEDALRTFRQFRDRMQAVLADDPRNVDAGVWLSSACHNMGNVLLRLDRPAEALPAYRKAIEQKGRVLTQGPRTKRRVQSLGSHYLALAEAHRALGRPAEAAATLREHPELWDNDPPALYKVACGLALCIPLVAEGRAGSSEGQQAERERYADEAIDVLQRAVAAGFRDLDKIRKDADLAPLRARSEFRDLVGRLSFPDDPFAPLK